MNKKRRPFYPVPSLPYIEKRIERSVDNSSLVSDKHRGKSSKSKKDKERRRKKRDRGGKERQHRRDGKIEKEGSSEMISIALEKLAVTDQENEESAMSVPLINRNYSHNNSSADLKAEELVTSKDDNTTTHDDSQQLWTSCCKYWNFSFFF